MVSFLAERLGGLAQLSTREHMALAALEQRERPLRRGAVLLREKDRVSELFVVRQGIMMSYVLLPEGSRQSLRFLFPGDLIGTAALAYRETTESIAALTDAVVCPLERAAFAQTLAGYPRIAGMVLALAQIERVGLTDRLAALGRTPAHARIAALLLELRDRLRATDASIGATFQLCLTQEEMGDATGLTAVHVNRMLRRLEEDALIARANGRVTLLDEAGLSRAAQYVDRSDRLDLGWLAAVR